MYKLLLSWRYLCTRYIALASIVSVTLGVATLIVVNSVMAGFTTEMHNRLHGILSDIFFESHGLGGMQNPAWHMHEIESIVGDDLQGMTAIVQVPAMLSFKVHGQWVTRQVNLIGIDEETYATVSDFGQYLLHPANQQLLSFKLHENNYGDRLPPSGWPYRRFNAQFEKDRAAEIKRRQQRQWDAPSPNAPEMPQDPFAPLNDAVVGAERGTTFDPEFQQHTGIVLGIAICSGRRRNSTSGQVEDYFYCRPGDDVQIMFPTAGTPPRVEKDVFTVVDFYESKMSEYDTTFAFVPLKKLQDLRGMIDPTTGMGAVSSIQLKLKEGADLNAVRDKLQARFPIEQYPYSIRTWRDMQGPLLSAVQMETTILNILLFLIIAVAGFGILATFFMIVVEKTRDIGILKALGAPSGGVMSIFLSYGVSLGVVGSGVGMVLGLLFVHYINSIADFLEWISGREVFDPTIYYFQEIPTIINPVTVLLVVLGAVLIAVLASVLPAIRAARLHPVEALRYE